MIAVNGVYYISLDGGLSWRKANNRLVKGYYEVDTSQTLHAALGEGDNPVSYNDISIEKDLVSTQKLGLSSNVSLAISDSAFSVTKEQTFSFEPGSEGEFREVGLYAGETLLSRSLIFGGEFGEGGLLVENSDSLKIRYSIRYEIPTNEIPVTINYKGKALNGLLNFVNPNKWGTSNNMGLPVIADNVASLNGAVISNDHYLSGGISLSTIGRESYYDKRSVGERSYQVSFFADLNSLIGEFDQIIFCNGAASTANAVAIITFEEKIIKTVDDTFGFTLSINQGAQIDT